MYHHTINLLKKSFIALSYLALLQSLLVIVAFGDTRMSPAFSLRHSSRYRENHELTTARLDQQVRFNIADHDEKRVTKFEILFLLRLHSIAMNHNLTVLQSTNVGDWTTAITIYEQMADTSDELERFTSNSDLAHFFSSHKAFLQANIELCRDIQKAYRQGQIIKYTNDQIFTLMGNNTYRGQIIYRSQERQLFQRWSSKYTAATTTLREEAAQEAARLKSVYQIDLRPIYEQIQSELPFQLPLSEFENESDYLYEAFIRDTDLSQFLKVYYKGDLVKIAGLIAIEAGYNLEELGLFYADLASTRLKAIAFADFIISASIDCADFYRKRQRGQYYADVVELHNEILAKLVDGSREISALIDLVKKVANSQKFAGSHLAAARYLLDLANQYLEERHKLETYVRRNQNMAQHALHRFNLGESDILLIDSDQKKLLRLGLSGRIRALLPSPCEVYGEMTRD
ncbi:MAG TPA: hypothetical protein VK619_08320 [Pyrinomonadaceae bacterium]|nr:hypothetical protein [Pyrinomonadaceae bacterium]